MAAVACGLGTLLLLLSVSLLPAAAAGAAGASDNLRGARIFVYFKDEVRGIGSATERVRVGAAARLASNAGALRAAAASGPGAYDAIAAMGRPLKIAYVTPYEVDPQGKGIPGANSIVTVHPRLSGRGDRAINIVDVIIKAIEAQPEVDYAVNSADLELRLSVACGPTATPANCGLGECCSAATGTCGVGDAFCGDACMPNHSIVAGVGCTNPVLERKRVLNTGWFGGTVNAVAMPDMTFIEATYYNPDKKLVTTGIGPDGLANYAVTAMVYDTGVGPHTDIRTVGGRNFAGDGEPVTAYGAIAWHGTHVAGTIGAKNDGVGSWGVMPNARIFSARLFSRTDYGNPVEALRYMQANANADNIAVINMSFNSYGTGTTGDRATKRIICALVADVADRWGTVFVSSIGNERRQRIYDWGQPVWCPEVIVVTALDSTSCRTTTVRNPDRTKTITRRCDPASFSNWLDNTASAADKRRTVTAPGVNIYSTIKSSKYDFRDGTSMAAPHVAGIALKCFVAGDCRFGDGTVGNGLGVINQAKILDAFALRNQDPTYKWADDSATWVAPDGTTRYYGNLAWGGRW